MSEKDDLDFFKNNAREIYDKIGGVYCPCLNSEVVFNAQGFHHMEYDGGGTARLLKERIFKLKLIPLAVPVLKCAEKIDEYKKDKQPKNRKKGAVQKDVEFWSLVANVGKNRDVKVKVVLKRTGNGKIIFWSIMKLKK